MNVPGLISHATAQREKEKEREQEREESPHLGMAVQADSRRVSMLKSYPPACLPTHLLSRLAERERRRRASVERDRQKEVCL